jgi:hypothetical protein
LQIDAPEARPRGSVVYFIPPKLVRGETDLLMISREAATSAQAEISLLADGAWSDEPLYTCDLNNPAIESAPYLIGVSYNWWDA